MMLEQSTPGDAAPVPSVGPGSAPTLDELASLAATVSGMPAVWIRLYGMPRGGAAGSLRVPAAGTIEEELPIDPRGVLVVSDTRQHPRLASHARVRGAPFLRFYASFPIHGPQGTLAGALCVADMVPRLLPDDRIQALGVVARQVEASLLQRAQGERAVRDAIWLLPVAVYLLRIEDPNDDSTLWILDANAAARRATRDDMDNLLGRPVEAAFPWARAHAVTARCARVARSGVAEELDLVSSESGGPIHALTIFPFGAGLVGVAFEDVTEPREIHRLKSEFVATVSHELRTPLASVRGAIGLLGGGVAGELPAAASRLVDIARDGTERLVRLVNEILDLERLRDGPIRSGRIEIAELVEKACTAVTGLANEAQIRVEPTLHAAGSIPGDPARLAQALANLVSNAVRYAPRGSRVAVIARETRAGRVRLEVRDEGEGMTAEQVSRIFLPFPPGEAGEPRPRANGGLGLAIARVIVEGHRGRVGVDTAPGRGAAFWMELPFEPGEAPAASVDMAEPRRALSLGRPVGDHPIRALVVDGDAGFRAIIADQFRAAGADVVEASDGASAIVSARARTPDLLVIDVDVARPDGFEVVDILRDSSARTAALVLLSARELTPAERARLLLGPTLFLTKAREDLANIPAFVREVFEGEPGPGSY